MFPTLPGLMWGVSKTPQWTTKIQKAVSGKEFRSAWMSAPLYTFRLSYEVLREGSAFQELQQLAAFFNNVRGSFDSFLYSDPADNAVTAQKFGTGNGVATQFQLVRSYGGNTEAVGALNGSPQIYKTDWQGRELQYLSPRSNMQSYSEDFTNAVWGKANVTVTANAALAPDGTNTASLITGTGGPGSLLSTQGGIYGLPYSSGAVSFYAKSGTLSAVSIGDNGWGNRASFDLAAGTCSGTGATIKSVGGGWYRCCVVLPMTYIYRLFFLQLGATYPGITTTGNVYMWGAQIEVNTSAVSSYVKTLATPVTVTDCLVNNAGLVTFTNAPAAGAQLDWSGSYYYRCRFLQDGMEFSAFMSKLWEAKRVEFVGSLSPNRI